MTVRAERVLITGGAGFVGSHLADRLSSEAAVIVVDNFSHGDRSFVPDTVTLYEGDLTDPAVVAEALTPDIDIVYHFAAAKAVDADQPRTQFEDNLAMTYNVLERMDETGVDRLVYTSSSTVYGEAPRPTPEDFAPLEPISPYGAGKLAEEGLISTYAHSHDIQTWLFRFANIVGPRLRGAVIPDFIDKLRENPEKLVILGDGRQEKSYMHVSACLDAMAHVIREADSDLNIFNLGTRTTTSVDTIAAIVSDELGLEPTYEYTGGERGWTGDVPRMRLSIEKLAGLGWEPAQSSDEAVRQATRDLLDER